MKCLGSRGRRGEKVWGGREVLAETLAFALRSPWRDLLGGRQLLLLLRAFNLVSHSVETLLLIIFLVGKARTRALTGDPFVQSVHVHGWKSWRQDLQLWPEGDIFPSTTDQTSFVSDSVNCRTLV